MKELLISLLLFLSAFTDVNSQVSYSVKVPKGTRACFIAGEMTGWTHQQMEQINDTLFSVVLSHAKTSQQYKYCSGPAWSYVETATGGEDIPNRNYHSIDAVARWSIAWDPTGNSPPSIVSGKITRHWFDSKIVDDRFVDVWVPDGYTREKKYDVLYMQDGQMLFDGSLTFNGLEWNMDGVMGELSKERAIRPAIIVAIHNNGIKRHAEFFPQSVLSEIPDTQKILLDSLFKGNTNSDDYLKFIVAELKPFIDANYSTHTDAAHTSIAGSSMGGLISMYAFCEYPEVFHMAACLSTHWIGTFNDNREIPAALTSYLEEKLPSAIGRKIYFDHGTIGLDASYITHQANVNAILSGKGYKEQQTLTIVAEGDDHSEKSWNKRIGSALKFILGSE